MHLLPEPTIRIRFYAGALLLVVLLLVGGCGKNAVTNPSNSIPSTTPPSMTTAGTTTTESTTQSTTTETTTVATTVEPLATVQQVDGTNGWYAVSGDAHTYPVTPWGTPEIWETFSTEEEMLAALQIPEGTLSSLTTTCLIEACIEYPMNLSFMHEPCLCAGVEQIVQDFNGLQELYQRPDAAVAFIAFYRGMNVDALFASEELPEFRLAYIEFLLSDANLIAQMTESQRIYLLDAVYANLMLHSSISTSIAEDTAKAVLLGRLLEASSQEYRDQLASDPVAQQFLDTGCVPESYIQTPAGLKEFIQPLVPLIQDVMAAA